MKYIIFFLFFSSCSPLTLTIAEDLIEGEVQVIEKVLEDTSPKGTAVSALKF